MSHPPVRFVARGGVWVVMQFALMIAAIAFGILFQDVGTRLPVRAVGAVLLVIGAVFGIAGVKRLGRNRTAYPRPNEDSELVQQGIYARVRHPLYTSVMLVSLGWALIWGSLPSAGAALVLVPFLGAKARREERWLCEKFPGYAEYARRVPRFIPHLGTPAK